MMTGPDETKTSCTEHPEDTAHSPDGAREIPAVVHFDHPFFSSIEGSHFRIRNGEDDVVMVVPLETGIVDLKTPGIIQELELPEESADVRMLAVVSEALNILQGIGIGDPIPIEMLTDQASWHITSEHRAAALARLSVRWYNGYPAKMTAILIQSSWRRSPMIPQ